MAQALAAVALQQDSDGGRGFGLEERGVVA
jgi:hypothetical protein